MITVGDTNVEAPTITVSPSDASGYTIRWSGGVANIATINSQTGAVNGIGVGTVTIKATLTNSDGSTLEKTYQLTVAEPVTNGPGEIGDRVLEHAQTGDGKWIEIAKNGAYSLIIKADTVTTTTFNTGNSYVAYASQDRNQQGTLRYEMNNWYANQLALGAKLRTFAVGHDASGKPGTWANLNASDGFSVPTGVIAIGEDIAFPISFQEAARYCSVSWYNGSSTVTSAQGANANWNKLNDRTSTWSWLRSPGYSVYNASYLISDGSVGSLVISNGDVNESIYSVRPALWVKSTIFNQ